MLYPVTTVSTLILGLWLFWLSVRVIGARRSEGVGLGAGESDKLERRIRAQGNLSEYAPITLILLFLAEAQSANYWLIVFSAVLLIVGRLIHGIAFSFTDKWVAGRFGGMVMTFVSLVILSLTNLWLVAGNLLS